MSRDPAEILKAALELPPEGRAALADSLLPSLDREIDEDAEATWQVEVHRRLRKLDSQAVAPMPWAEVRSPPLPPKGARFRGVLPHDPIHS